MPGTALDNFTDFVKMTGPAYLTSADKMINEAVKQSYSLDRFLRGKGLDKVIQGGDVILDDIMFDDASTAQNYNPNAEFTWTQPQVVTEVRVPWRFTIDHMSWTDHEIELNMNAGYTRAYANVQYKRMRMKIEQRMWTSMINFIESRIWQNAHTAAQELLMEQTGGSQQFSVPAFIEEDTTNFHPAGWTTVMNVNPANEDKWRVQVETYDFDDPDDSDGDNDGLIDAFDNIIVKTQFIPPMFHRENFEPMNVQGYRNFIACSRTGLNLYKRLLRAANDTLIRKQDAAYPHPQFDGIDLVYVTQLDAPATGVAGTSSIFAHGGGTAYNEIGQDSAGATVSGARDGNRFFWVNGNYLTPVFHSSRYFYKKDPFFLEKQPYTWVCPIDCWWNLFCQSRQRQGIVAPNA